MVATGHRVSNGKEINHSMAGEGSDLGTVRGSMVRVISFPEIEQYFLREVFGVEVMAIGRGTVGPFVDELAKEGREFKPGFIRTLAS